MFFSVLKNLLYVQSGSCTENKTLKKTDIGFEKIQNHWFDVHVL